MVFFGTKIDIFKFIKNFLFERQRDDKTESDPMLWLTPQILAERTVVG